MTLDQRFATTDDIHVLGPSELSWQIWLLYGVLTAVVLGLSYLAYRAGVRRGARIAPLSQTVERVVEKPLEDSEALVTSLIQAYDLASGSPAMRAHLEQSLQRAGVEIVPCQPGDAFNPSAHDALETRRAPDPSQAHTIAEVLRPGWRRATGLVRTAEVAVWTI